MTIALPLSAFVRLPPAIRATWIDGLPGAIDAVAARAREDRRFLRHGWFAAAIDAYGGRPRTLVVADEGVAQGGGWRGGRDVPLIALPTVALGPRVLGLAQVPGSYWPSRGFPAAEGTPPDAWRALVRALGARVRGLRIGPVPDDDPAVRALVAAARARGWVALDRMVAEGFVLDLTAPGWPRGSTLRKNRFHEKHLAGGGTPAWTFPGAADWPAAFDAFAQVEEASWVGRRTDGRDAKFTAAGHGGFWRAAARDPALARAMSGALLTVDGRPAAFAFDLDVGRTRHAIANGYDPAFARHSPGRLLQYRSLTRAQAAGIERVDWGMGDTGYKRAMGAVAGADHRDWLLLRPGLPALLGRALAARWRASGATPGR